MSCDASSYGLGAVLFQRVSPDSPRQPICCASRSLTSAEFNYAQIEKKALAITWACDRFANFLLGLPVFTIETDHKPLIPLLNTKQLHSLPPRVLRFRLRLARFNYLAVHVPGKHMYSANALSRAVSNAFQPPVLPSSLSDLELSTDADACALSVLEVAVPPDRLTHIVTAQEADPVSRSLKTFIVDGWPTSAQQLPANIRPFWPHCHQLTVVYGIICCGPRLFIPASLQEDTLQLLHAAHQSERRCKLLASTSVWWPSISSDITRVVSACQVCRRCRPQPTAPVLSTDTPERVWQMIGTNLFQVGRQSYIVIVDYYSRYIEVVPLSSTTSSSVITALYTVFVGLESLMFFVRTTGLSLPPQSLNGLHLRPV